MSLVSMVRLDAAPSVLHKVSGLIAPGASDQSRFYCTGLGFAFTGDKITFARNGRLVRVEIEGEKPYPSAVGWQPSKRILGRSQGGIHQPYIPRSVDPDRPYEPTNNSHAPSYEDDRGCLPGEPGYERAKRWEKYQRERKNVGWLLTSLYEAACNALPKHGAVVATTEYSKVQRRLARFKQELATLPPAPLTLRGSLFDSRTAYVHGLASYGVRALGLQDEAVASLLKARGVHEDLTDVLLQVRESGIIAPDCIGVQLDEEAAEVARREQAQEAAKLRVEEQKARTVEIES